MPSRSAPLGPIFLALSFALHGVGLAVAVAPRSHAPTVPAPPASRGAATGDTFELPTDDLLEDQPATPGGEARDTAASLSPSREPSSPPHDPHGAGAVARRAAAARPSSSSVSPSESGDGAHASSARFGAVGERGAAPLAATFTRGFPQAASADPIWLSVPFGSAGSAIVDLTLSEDGTLTDSRTRGSPSPALREGIRRTLALLRARSFVAEGEVTHLRVTATVSPDQVHDGLHGDTFALGAAFDGGEGSGFFSLNVGRRIDIRVKAVR